MNRIFYAQCSFVFEMQLHPIHQKNQNWLKQHKILLWFRFFICILLFSHVCVVQSHFSNCLYSCLRLLKLRIDILAILLTPETSQDRSLSFPLLKLYCDCLVHFIAMPIAKSCILDLLQVRMILSSCLEKNANSIISIISQDMDLHHCRVPTVSIPLGINFWWLGVS